MPPVPQTSFEMKTSPGSTPSSWERWIATSHGTPTISATPVFTGAHTTSPCGETSAAPKSDVSFTNTVWPARSTSEAISSAIAWKRLRSTSSMTGFVARAVIIPRSPPGSR